MVDPFRRGAAVRPGYLREKKMTSSTIGVAVFSQNIWSELRDSSTQVRGNVVILFVHFVIS